MVFGWAVSGSSSRPAYGDGDDGGGGRGRGRGRDDDAGTLQRTRSHSRLRLDRRSTSLFRPNGFSLLPNSCRLSITISISPSK